MKIYSLEFCADNLVVLLVPIASSVKISSSRARHEVVHNRVVFFEVLQTDIKSTLYNTLICNRGTGQSSTEFYDTEISLITLFPFTNYGHSQSSEPIKTQSKYM